MRETYRACVRAGKPVTAVKVARPAPLTVLLAPLAVSTAYIIYSILWLAYK